MIIIVNFAIAQVGINTGNPQQIFHVDGSNDNNVSGIPSPTQQANDVVVTADGEIGIGTASPSTNLHINSSNGPALRLVDGTQGEGKILTSDENGNAKWNTNSIPRIIATFGTGYNLPYADDSNFYQTGTHITIPPGKWAITVFSLLAPQGTTTPNDWMWVRSTFSDSSSSVTRTSDITDAPFLVSGAVHGPIPFHSISGTIVINNNSNVSKTYYYIVGGTDASSNLPANTNYILNVGGAWGENIIYAMPIDS